MGQVGAVVMVVIKDAWRAVMREGLSIARQ